MDENDANELLKSNKISASFIFFMIFSSIPMRFRPKRILDDWTGVKMDGLI